ncbi:DUF805 domain-containing protein [Methylobacterium brachythecii]|nr:DUF805 domain-containing protein [Methylobacterium brachythecii]MBB3902910.1 uncharacterized membrane protein YhaH (DUF805 family) [Methylobacterium brachythecii]
MTKSSESEAATFGSLVKRNYLASLRRCFDFSGRSGLSEYWSYFVVYLCILVVAVSVDALLSLFVGRFRGFRAIVILFHMLPNLAILARRMHDIDRRAWFMLWPFVAANGLYQSGTPGPNRFGPEPVDLVGS